MPAANFIELESNFSLFFLLSLALVVIFSIIKSRIDYSKCSLQIAVSLINDAQLRLPFGFFVLILGWLIIISSQLYDKFHQASHISSEILIFIGFSIVFWPTILVVTYKLLGAGRDPVQYTKTALLLIILFKLFLTFSAVIVYYLLPLG